MITGNKILKIEGERKNMDLITGLKFNIGIEDVQIAGDGVTVKYTFEVNYSGKKEEVGHIKISGEIEAKEEKKVLNEIEKEWKDKKRLPIEFAETVINTINFVCGANGTLVSFPLGLTPPIPMPQAKLQPSESSAS